jgi:hypothetical protein
MFYHNYLPNVSSLLHPLYQLLKKTRKWHWDKSCEDAYAKAKELIAKNVCLTHFEPGLPIILATYAGPRGIGAVLSHCTNSGEKAICFGSRSLTGAEQNYSQLDREGLAIVWAERKMKDYLFGQSFGLITDKPIAVILSPNKATPAMVAARLQIWASFLSNYNYIIESRSTEEHANADFCSRLPFEVESKTAHVSAIDASMKINWKHFP